MRETYVVAAIKYHKRYGFVDHRWLFYEDEFDSFGEAQVSDIEMETPYGVEIKDEITKDIRKTGLGLRNGPCKDSCAMDQDDPDVAVIAMRTRLTLRLDVCMQHDCTATDMFIIAAISADEQIHPSKLKAPLGPFKNSDYESANPATTVNWQEFINANWKDPEDRQNIIDLIHGVQAEVMKLQEDGYYVPGVQWGYVTDLK